MSRWGIRSRIAVILTVSCAACSTPRVVEVDASFREIWLGAEQVDTGKRAEPNELVTLTFDEPVSSVGFGAKFEPIESCGHIVEARLSEPGPRMMKVEFRPAEPLERGCVYTLTLPKKLALTDRADGRSVPFVVPFRVAKDERPPGERELVLTTDSRDGHRTFVAQKGINTPIRRALERYQRELGVAASDLVLSPSQLSQRCSTEEVFYAQHSQGYEVDYNYGYTVCEENGIFRKAMGSVASDLPHFGAPRLTEQEALKAAIWQATAGFYGRETEFTWFRLPAAKLHIVSAGGRSKGSQYALTWHFDFSGTEFVAVYSADIDALNGKLIDWNSAIIVE